MIQTLFDFFVAAHVKVDQSQAAELLKSQNQSQVSKDLERLQKIDWIDINHSDIIIFMFSNMCMRLKIVLLVAQLPMVCVVVKVLFFPGPCCVPNLASYDWFSSLLHGFFAGSPVCLSPQKTNGSKFIFSLNRVPRRRWPYLFNALCAFYRCHTHSGRWQ